MTERGFGMKKTLEACLPKANVNTKKTAMAKKYFGVIFNGFFFNWFFAYKLNEKHFYTTFMQY